MKPPITILELQKIEQLLDSASPTNIELGLLILSGFALEIEGANWLYHYYKQLFSKENNPQQHSLQQITIGTIDSNPTKASRLLTLLFQKAPIAFQKTILKDFIQNETLTLPRIETTTLPNIIYQFPILKHISIRYGAITTISKDIVQLKALETLDLAHQPLIFIDTQLASLPHLTTLIVRNAAILPDEIVDKSNLDIMIEGAY